MLAFCPVTIAVTFNKSTKQLTCATEVKLYFSFTLSSIYKCTICTMCIAIWRDFFPLRVMRKGRCYSIRFSISLGYDGVVVRSKIVRSFASGRKALFVHMRQTHVYERRSWASSAASPEVEGSFSVHIWPTLYLSSAEYFEIKYYVLLWSLCGEGSVKDSSTFSRGTCLYC